jgi:AcrR family transcriptional regulator
MIELVETPTRREARKADRRRAIIDVAKRSFLERGYAETSMSTIAAALGGSKTTLWTYFRSKEELFAAVIDTKVAAFRAKLDEALIPGGGTGAALGRFGRVLMSKVLSPESVALLRLIVSEAERFPEMGRAFAEHGPDRVRLRLSVYIEEEMAAGRLRSGDALNAARQFIALCQAGCYLERLWRPGGKPSVDPDLDVASAVDTFMQAWGPQA